MGSEGIDVNTACKIFRPIRWSKKDTRLTQEQVVELNKVWKANCQ